MNYLRCLAKTQAVAFGWLVVCSVLFAIALYAFFASGDSTLSIKDALGQIVFVVVAVFVFATLPVLLFAAPAYAWLSSKGVARWWSSLGIGLVPGIAMIPFELPLAWYALIVGSAVALLTHMTMRNSANNSFKPRPLRGSAAW